MPKATLLLFGRLGDSIGREISLDIPVEGTSVAQLRRAHPALAAADVRAAIDQRLAEETDIVRPGQEIAFFPPLSGG